jgi:hypothetical protein
MEGPVNWIRGAPVRAERTNSIIQIRRRSILCGSWPEGRGSALSLVSEPDLTSTGDRGRECRDLITDKRRKR